MHDYWYKHSAMCPWLDTRLSGTISLACVGIWGKLAFEANWRQIVRNIIFMRLLLVFIRFIRFLLLFIRFLLTGWLRRIARPPNTDQVIPKWSSKSASVGGLLYHEQSNIWNKKILRPASDLQEYASYKGNLLGTTVKCKMNLVHGPISFWIRHLVFKAILSFWFSDARITPLCPRLDFASSYTH